MAHLIITLYQIHYLWIHSGQQQRGGEQWARRQRYHNRYSHGHGPGNKCYTSPAQGNYSLYLAAVSVSTISTTGCYAGVTKTVRCSGPGWGHRSRSRRGTRWMWHGYTRPPGHVTTRTPGTRGSKAMTRGSWAMTRGSKAMIRGNSAMTRVCGEAMCLTRAVWSRTPRRETTCTRWDTWHVANGKHWWGMPVHL